MLSRTTKRTTAMASLAAGLRHLASPGMAMLVVALLASCAPVVIDAPLPTHPPMPDGWNVVEEDHGAVRLALPPDIVATHTDGLIVANEPPPPGRSVWLEVSAVGPGFVEPELEAGQSLRSWFEQQLNLEPALGPMSFTPFTLPAGRGTVLRTTVAEGSPNATLVVWFAISTGQGIGYLRFQLPPDEEVGRRDDIEMIAQLLDL